jgi:hypothetical protein
MKVQLPWMGKATGSSAGLIYQSYWGRTFARTFPAIFHYPNTHAQQACQAKYWHLRLEVEGCYERLRYDLSDYQKRIKNPYNQLFQSARTMFESQTADPTAPWQLYFGVDALNAISVDVMTYQSHITPQRVICDALVNDVTSKFDFFPKWAWICLVNWTRQELWTRKADYGQGWVQQFWPNDTGWPSTDFVVFYIGVSNNHYMSNFYLTKHV